MSMKAGRIGTLVFWVLVILALFNLYPPQLNHFMLVAGSLILAAHVIEVLMMYTVWRDKAKPVPADIFWVLVYGAFHLKPLLLGKRG